MWRSVTIDADYFWKFTNGAYDFDVIFARDVPQPSDDSAAPLLPAALQSELGLKLERSKAPIEVLVIDHLEKPSEN